MLLILFNGHTEPAVAIAEAVITAPAPAHGYPVDRDATSGDWQLVLELGDPAAGELFAWHDITEFYAGDSYQRGANEYLGKYAAAVAQVQLQTDNDELAPWGQDTSALFGVDIPLDAGLLMRLSMIRVVSGVVVEWDPIWTGRVETWGDASAARGQIRTHVITVVDTIGDLANVPTTIEANAVPISTWLTENLTDAQWLFGVDFYGDDPADMPQDLTPAAAITRMDQAADPNGLVWRSLRTGRLVVYPAPWDTTNTARWSNPLLDSYPSGLVFSFSPDFTDIEYIDDDDQTPFGIQRTSLGVLNDFMVTTPSDLWLEDDPVSIARYGRRPFTATWIVNALEQVVVDLLDARAYSSAQALPLRTTLDHEGFWSAMAIVDHLDPVTIIHATNDEGPVVTATGVVRNVTEQRTVRGDGLLSWQSTVQIDLDATDTSPALLPVEDLAVVAMNTPLLGGPSSAEFSWTNPTQPDITPTNVQLRMLGRSIIWFDTDYPGVGADGATLGFLSAATPYTLQVRLIRRVNGVITAFSATRSIAFTTPALILPQFVPDGDSTDVIVGEPPDFDSEDCVLEVELQENDGTGWTTIESFDQSDLVQNGDGTWSLIYPIPNSTFVNDRIYRFRSREVCGGIDGQWYTGSSFDPPDNWTDPCVTPPALADPPYDDVTLTVYVPKVCQGDDIVEAVSGISGVKGDAFDGFVQMLDEPDRIALLAIADPEWSTTPSGILAYGECPQINGKTGDKTMGVYVAVANNEPCVLFECANMSISAGVGSGSNWVAQASINTPSGAISLISGDIPTGPDGVSVFVTFEAATGDVTLAVDGVVVDSDTFGGPTLTSVALPIWRVGAPPESWITDCALWSSVIVPTFDPIAVGWMHMYWCEGPEFVALGLADGATTADWPDEINTTGTDDLGQATSGKRPTYRASGTGLSLPCLDFDGGDCFQAHTYSVPPTLPSTVVVLGYLDSTTPSPGAGIYAVDGTGAARRIIGIDGGSGKWGHYAGTWATDSAAPSTGIFASRSKVVSGTSDVLTRNGSTVTTATAGDSVTVGITVGSDTSGAASFLDGRLYFVGFFNGDVTTDPLWADFVTWAASKGFTIS